MGLERHGLRTSKVDRLAALSAVLVISACSTGGDSMQPEPMTGSISVSVSPTSGSAEQGGETVVTATVTRSGGFSGSVTISVTGAPSGVTASVGTASTMGTVTVAPVAIEVGPDVDPGVYTLTVRASGSGVSTATATYSLTVAVAPGFQIDLFPTEVSIEQGAEANVAVTVFGTNFGQVDLSLEGPDPTPPPAGPSLGPLPDGVTAEFDPNPTNGNSTLTITVGAAVAAAVHELTVRGTSAGVDSQIAALQLTVTDGGGGPMPNIDFEPTEIGTGASHGCRIDGAGAGFCWGADFAGQLGDAGANTVASSPVAVAGNLTLEWIVTGGSHSCGLTAAGQGYCWGQDDDGELGNDAGFVNQSAPVAVSGNHTFVGLTAAGGITCGLTAAGQAYCWGSDFHSQLGDGPPNQNQPQPALVSGGITFRAISAGALHVCGLDLTGQAWCWGNDGSGELGNGSPPQNRNVPVAVGGNHTFEEIAAGDGHSCALTAQGQAYCWGADFGGQVGDGAVSASLCGGFGCAPEPVLVSGTHVFDQVFAGGSHSCGLDAVGNAYCWGMDDQGQVGDGPGSPALCNGLGCAPTPVAVAGGHQFRELDLAVWLTCGVDMAGDAWCWGDDSGQQLGNGAGINDQAVPGKVDNLP